MKRVDSSGSELNDFTEENGKKVYNVSKSRIMSLVNWISVLNIYTPMLWFAGILFLAYQLATIVIANQASLQSLFADGAVVEMPRSVLMDLSWKVMAIGGLCLWYFATRGNPVYIIDFSTFEPPASWRITLEQTMKCMKAKGCFNEDSMKFMDRMLQQSGVGPATAWPPGMVQALEGKPVDASSEASRQEAETVITTAVRELLEKTKTNPKKIDILVINCSLFSPTPSLCSMVVNEFGMRSDVSSYNLSGMGCSAGLISIELVKNLLASKPNSTALVVSTEIITSQLYHGQERSFLVQNTLFRCGGAAVLLSNKWTDAYRALFKLLHVVRTQYVSDDSYGCVYQTEDDYAMQGVRLSKDIVKVAGRAMEKNFTSLGPYVLPISEQLKTGFWMLARFLAKKAKNYNIDLGKINPYIPDFKRGIDHFCIHAGGRGVIDGIEKNLSLTPQHVAASRYTLFTYGNTSSSSIWYEMDYIRKHTDLHRGQRVMQVAFGSGFKCNTAVWLCLNNKYRVKKSASPTMLFDETGKVSFGPSPDEVAAAKKGN